MHSRAMWTRDARATRRCKEHTAGKMARVDDPKRQGPLSARFLP